MTEKEIRRAFFHLEPRPISYVEMIMRNLECRFGKPKETITGNIQQLIYDARGTILTLEIVDTGVTAKGIESKVRIYFHSNNKESIEAVTMQKGWDLLDLKRSDFEIKKLY